jgi:hypothetical protein
MPINNTKGLDALRALSEGGSAGLNAYKQAQGAEQASRTTALQNALGGQDVAAAAAKAQAQYAPKVPTQGLNVGDLGAAANSYLSQAANKLSAQNYEDQQNLTLQGESLRRHAVSDKDRMLMLQGASDIKAEGDQEAANKQIEGQYGTNAIGTAMEQRKAQAAQLAQLQQGIQASGGGLATPETAAQVAALQAQIGQSDQALRGLLGKYAMSAGTDANGFNAAVDEGDMGKVEGLVNFLTPQITQNRQAAEGEAKRKIEMGGQERLRQLAPAFGVNPLVAAGQFQEGKGDDLAIAGNKAKQDAYIADAPTASDRKAQDAQVADSLGFDSPTDFTRLRSKTGMGTEDIVGAMQSPHWGKIQEIANGVATGEIENGSEGFSDTVKNYVNSLTGPDGKQMSQKERAALIELANTYFKPGTTAAAGKGEAE